MRSVTEGRRSPFPFFQRNNNSTHDGGGWTQSSHFPRPRESRGLHSLLIIMPLLIPITIPQPPIWLQGPPITREKVELIIAIRGQMLRLNKHHHNPLFLCGLGFLISPQIILLTTSFALKTWKCLLLPQENAFHTICSKISKLLTWKWMLMKKRKLWMVPLTKGVSWWMFPRSSLLQIHQVCSKRSWDGKVKKWRRRLHEFDPPMSENEETPQLFSSDDGDDGSADHSQDEKDATTTSGSEGNPKEEAGGISAIYDDWNIDDAMEP